MNEFTSSIGQPNAVSIGFFLVFVLATLVITYYAAKRSKTASQF